MLLGDVHQPLHWLHPHSNHGRDIKVSWQGTQRDLLSFFEDYLPQQLGELPKQKHLDMHFKAQQEYWKKGRRTPPELFRRWGHEAAAAMCQHVLTPMEVVRADGSRSVDELFYLDEPLYNTWMNLTEEFTIRAGERLAYVLLDILQHRRSELGHKLGKASWNVHSLKRPHGFMANAGIAMVVVPLWLSGLWWHAGDLGRALRSTCGGGHTKGDE